jgi:hypothetical protein
VSLNAVTVRARALTLIKLQADQYIGHASMSEQYTLDGVRRPIGAYLLPINPNLHRHCNTEAEADAVAASVVNATYRRTRSLLQRFNSFDRAAAVLVLACRSNPALVMRGAMRLPLADWYDAPTPTNGNVPTLATEMLMHRYSYFLNNSMSSYFNFRFRAMEALYFFGKPVVKLSTEPDPQTRLLLTNTWT